MDDDTYSLVGPCYVDDVMDGEVMSALSAGDAHFGPFWTQGRRKPRLETVKLAVESVRII